MRLDERSRSVAEAMQCEFLNVGQRKQKGRFAGGLISLASYPSISALSSLIPSGAAPPQRVLGSLSSNGIGLGGPTYGWGATAIAQQE